MAEDMMGVRFLDHDEMVFNFDEAVVRDKSLKLMHDVGYGKTGADFGKADDGRPLVEMKTMGDDGHDAIMDFAEGSDFHIF